MQARLPSRLPAVNSLRELLGERYEKLALLSNLILRLYSDLVQDKYDGASKIVEKTLFKTGISEEEPKLKRSETIADK